ncbi:MAG: LysR substrate-binding domain-containing protein [Xanthobacteraceae bacterium]
MPAQSRRTFRLSVGHRRTLFPAAAGARLDADAPRILIETLSPPLAERLTDGLASGEIDLAVGFIPRLGKRVREQVLFSEKFVYLMRRGHPAADDALTASRNPLPAPRGSESARYAASPCGGEDAKSPQVRSEIALRVRSFLSIGPIVADTNLVALVPSNLAALVANNLDVCVRPPKLKFPLFDVSMCWHQRFHQDPAPKWLRGILLDLFGRDGGPFTPPIRASGPSPHRLPRHIDPAEKA